MDSNTESFNAKLSQLADTLNHHSLNGDTPGWIKPLLTSMLDFVAEIPGILNNFQAKYTQLESSLEVQKVVTDALVEDRDKLKVRLFELQCDLEDQMQYSRRNCLLVHGLPEPEKESESSRENTDSTVMELFENTLGAGISKWDIGRSHRLGKRKTTPRPVIVRFVSYRQRKSVFDLKKKLKGKKIYITESLTKQRYELLNKCKETFGQFNVWSIDGRIHCQTPQDGKIVCTNLEDLAVYST